MMRYLGVDLAWGEGSAAKPANRSGVIALEASGTIGDAGWTIGLESTIDWIQRHAADDALLFVDAPLVITNATGPRLADRQTGQRYGRWWVSANSVNLRSPGKAGVHLRERLEALGWRYSDGRDGPPSCGQVLSECYPYTAIVGVPELGYEDKRPAYKRASKGMPAAEAWPIRTAECDELIRRVAQLAEFDPPVDVASHPETNRLLVDPSPASWRDYKLREDLLDAVICAWTAAYWHRHGFARSQLLGLPEQQPGDDLLLPTIIAPARPEQRPARSPALRCAMRGDDDPHA
jgi:predicted RNase H-like nuclease